MQRRLPKRLVSSLAAIASLFLLHPALAQAISSAGFAAYPTGKATDSKPYFIYALAAGQTHSDSLTVANTTNYQQTVQLYAVDAIQTSGGGFGLLPQTSPRQDVGSWIHLPFSSLTLAAHAMRNVTFTIQVPAQTTVGQHLGGIIVQPVTAATQQQTGNTVVTIVPRLGVRIYETVPGTANAHLDLAPLIIDRQGNSVTVTAKLTNSGNTLLSPTGTIVLTNTLGRLVDSQQLPAGQLFRPGQTLTIRRVFTLPSQSIQHYNFTENVQYTPTKAVQANGSLWVHWQLLLVPGGLLAAVLIYLAYRYKKNRQI